MNEREYWNYRDTLREMMDKDIIFVSEHDRIVNRLRKMYEEAD